MIQFKEIQIDCKFKLSKNQNKLKHPKATYTNTRTKHKHMYHTYCMYRTTNLINYKWQK